jgi:hypothetical protein
VKRGFFGNEMSAIVSPWKSSVAPAPSRLTRAENGERVEACVKIGTITVCPAMVSAL